MNYKQIKYKRRDRELTIQYWRYIYKYCRNCFKKNKKTRKHKESAVKNRKLRNKKWFSKAWNGKYKDLKIISKSLNRNPNNHFLRTRFYQLRWVYKSICRDLKRRYDQQLIKKLATVQTTNPNNFWNLSKQLKTGEKFVSNKEDLPPFDEIRDHYMKLL